MLKKRTIPLVISLLTLLFSSHASLSADLELRKKQNENGADKALEPYMLPRNHPLKGYLSILFSNPNMFKSSSHFRKAGFHVIRGHRKLMVGGHPHVPDYLFKKFPNSMPQAKQLENFLKRQKGAQVLRNYILTHNYKYLVIPQKWLIKLPRSFSQGDKDRSYVLVVDNMDIHRDYNDPNGICRQLYYNMSVEMLTELCTILHAVGGCDAFPRNQPFTKEGKIAFVDTEHVGKMKGHFLKHIVPALNEELQAYAIALWNKLEDEENERRLAKRSIDG
ncbi:conserved putative secreted protein [Candidatus Protochlamydia naegleriophila]|uniref:Conserved putative secreted protein n=1 Tax=Candidatus Protochlamydia naegleriophila TaxID=389348 RepID=A0A0U5J9A6_9BACT|nr:hypothetical protein [Candidatus Protochlamydia naegleriophila]CUI16617.1 conserved putative secreted protein [Candidatus Protochlamydia naegleriophila]